MRILVTGASGFVGRWLIEELGANGHSVIGLAGRQDVDLEDRAAMVDVIIDQAPDAVAHLAAISGGVAAARDPEAAFRTNVGGTINLLEACIRVPEPPVVLLASSSEVYGWTDPEQLPIVEDAPLDPHGSYALSKAAQESVVLAYHVRHGTRVAVARAFNHGGPGQRADFALPSFASRVVEALRTGGTEIAVGDIDVARDFLDVRDVVIAYRLLLERLRADTSLGALVTNVASERATPLRALLDRMCRRAGAQLEYRVDPSLVRRGEPRQIRGDSGRLRALTGWAPRRTADQMVDDLWDWAASSGGLG
jgi:GDP-4-dehydro-6-deoxy-D-mannose reductase